MGSSGRAMAYYSNVWASVVVKLEICCDLVDLVFQFSLFFSFLALVIGLLISNALLLCFVGGNVFLCILDNMKVVLCFLTIAIDYKCCRDRHLHYRGRWPRSNLEISKGLIRSHQS